MFFLFQPGWRPTNFPGCTLWLRADMGITLNGATVAGWADQSGNGHDAGQITPDNQPTYIATGINGLPSVQFIGTGVGTDDYMTTGAFAINQPNTSFVVGYTSDTTSNRWFLDGLGNNTRIVRCSGTAHAEIYAGALVASAAVLSNNVAADICAVFNGASSKVGVNGVFTAGDPGAGNASGVTLGRQPAGANPLSGVIAEVILYDRVLSPEELAFVHQYFVARYAL